MKNKKLQIINSLEVSSPCTNDNFATNSNAKEKGWFCGECKKDVHDLSRYTPKEVLALIKKSNGDFCALIKKRSDGSLVTREPVSFASSYSGGLIAAGVLLASGSIIGEQAHAQTVAADSNLQVAKPGKIGVSNEAVHEIQGGIEYIGVNVPPRPNSTVKPTPNPKKIDKKTLPQSEIQESMAGAVRVQLSPSPAATPTIKEEEQPVPVGTKGAVAKSPEPELLKGKVKMEPEKLR